MSRRRLTIADFAPAERDIVEIDGVDVEIKNPDDLSIEDYALLGRLYERQQELETQERSGGEQIRVLVGMLHIILVDANEAALRQQPLTFLNGIASFFASEDRTGSPPIQTQ